MINSSLRCHDDRRDMTIRSPRPKQQQRSLISIMFLHRLLLFLLLRISHALTPPLLTTSTSTTTTTTASTLGPALLLQNIVSDASVRNVQWLSSRLGSATYDATDTDDKLASQVKAMASISSSGVNGGDADSDDGDLMDVGSVKPRRERQRILRLAMSQLEKDLNLLERMAGPAPPLSLLELVVLIGSVASVAVSPIALGSRVTEFLAPSLAALIAAVGISAEVVGKTATANGKEVAAATMQCVAEAEGLLANAERAKAILPLCVGISTVAATCSLLVPVALDLMTTGSNLQLATEIYLLCPLVSVLSAATSSLCLRETTDYCNRAIGVGNRRFAPSTVVGRTWLSQTEQIQTKSRFSLQRWQSFALSVIPAPLLGSLVPGASLSTKTVVISALAAAQTAWFLTQAEYELSTASDAVAIKARSSAVCDTYANQASRSAAILPFTSALSGLCAAATAAVVELPLLDALSLSPQSVPTVLLQVALATVFPALSSLFAAAAAVSKARCEIDSEAAVLAASTLAIPYDGAGRNRGAATGGDGLGPNLLQPLRSVQELISTVWDRSVVRPLKRWIDVSWRLFRRQRQQRRRRRRKRNGQSSYASSSRLRILRRRSADESSGA